MKIKFVRYDEKGGSTQHVDSALVQTVIENAFIGPVLVNGDLCVSIFARDNGFEGFIWTGAPLLKELPEEAFIFSINSEDGIQVTQEI